MHFIHLDLRHRSATGEDLNLRVPNFARDLVVPCLYPGHNFWPHPRPLDHVQIQKKYERIGALRLFHNQLGFNTRVAGEHLTSYVKVVWRRRLEVDPCMSVSGVHRRFPFI